jgi:predicted DNA-binding transcriptional regulator AlpA
MSTAADTLAAGLPAAARLIDREAAAAALGISLRKLDELFANEEGPRTIQLGRRRLYPVHAIEDWIRERVAASN